MGTHWTNQDPVVNLCLFWCLRVSNRDGHSGSTSTMTGVTTDLRSIVVPREPTETGNEDPSFLGKIVRRGKYYLYEGKKHLNQSGGHRSRFDRGKVTK